MSYANVQHQCNTWLPNLWTTLRQVKQNVRQPAPAQQIQLQPGDFYYLAAGAYRLRVLAGSVWVPEVGIFAAGEQAQLTSGPLCLSVQTFPNQAVVFELRLA